MGARFPMQIMAQVVDGRTLDVGRVVMNGDQTNSLRDPLRDLAAGDLVRLTIELIGDPV